MTRREVFFTWCLLLALTENQFVLGQVYEVGSTVRHKQQTASAERMVSRDDNGFAQIVWTQQDFMDPLGNAYYVSWDPVTEEFFMPGGVQIHLQSRTGSPVQTTLGSGFCFPAFTAIHSLGLVTTPHVAIDFIDNAGAFTSYAPDPLNQGGGLMDIVGPRITHTANNTLHMASVELLSLENEPAQIFYSRGLPVFDTGFGIEIIWQDVAGDDQYLVLDSAAYLAHVIAASQTGNRVAVVFVRNANPDSIATERSNADVFVKISENGGLSWGPSENITQFIQPDVPTYCAGADLTCCNRDTLRAYMHLSALFDNEANLHVAYSTIAYYTWTEAGPTAIRNDRAMLWHWDESSNEHHLIAEYWDPHEDTLAATFGLEPEQAILEHPSLSYEPSTDYLYCAYLAYQADQHLPNNPLINADVVVSRSTDGGVHWSDGVNITNTEPTNNQNRSEQDLSVAETVVSSELYMLYFQFRASWFDIQLPASEIYFERLPLDELDFGDNVTDRPLHVDTPICDTTARAVVRLISVSQVYCDSVVVTFQASSVQGISSAIVYRNNTPLAMLPVVSIDTMSWSDLAPHSFPSSYYVVGNHPQCGLTAPSEWGTGVVADPPGLVTEFEASQNHWQNIYLDWSPSAPSDSVIAYDIFRDSVWQVQLPGDCTSYVDEIGISGNQYVYGIRALNEYCLGDTVFTPGRTIPRNDGSATLELASAGPPDWDYRLNWQEGCVDRLTIRSLCPGTVASFIGTTGDFAVTQLGDSVVFSGTPLCQREEFYTGFRLSNTDPNCVGNGTWTAGSGGGDIQGPLPAHTPIELPDQFSVAVYPNPFNPTANFKIALPQAADVRIVVYDILGQTVRDVSMGRFEAGNHVVPFDGSRMPTGIYFARIQAGEFEETHKLMLLK